MHPETYGDIVSSVHLQLKPMVIQSPNYRFCPFCQSYLRIRIEEGDKERKYCPLCHWVYFPTVSYSAMGLLVRDGKVLMVKRALDPHKDTWMFPAGFAEYGEHPQEAMIRELKEELGIEVYKSRLIDVFQSTDDVRAPGHLVMAYLVNASSDSAVNMAPEENLEIGWHDILAKPPEIGFKIHREELWPWLVGNIHRLPFDGKRLV